MSTHVMYDVISRGKRIENQEKEKKLTEMFNYQNY